MSNAIVALHGWNSSTRGWNESAWNSEVALPGATGAINSATITGFANVSVTGVVGTSAISDVFTTNVGVFATSALGDVFTASVNSATVDSSGEANIEVTGVFATGLVSSVTDFPIVWGQIIPSQTPNFSAISPSQNPSWTDIAA